MDYKTFVNYLKIAAEAHQEHTNIHGKTHRELPSGELIPYFLHPFWCATMVLMEPLLPENKRLPYALALLFHDILEDTSVALPQNLPKNVVNYIHTLTVPKEAKYNFSSWEKEKNEILQKPIDIQLLKLYDKTATLYDQVLQKSRFEEWSDIVLKLAENVEKEYGTLNIVLIARTIATNIRKK